MPTRGRIPPNQVVAGLSRAPHVGKAAVVLLALLLVGVAGAERTGLVPLISAGFLGFAALTATLFLLCLYDLVISVLELRYDPVALGASNRFRVPSDVVQEYLRWLSPLGFVVGIIFGHYFWQ